jgi:hypothetical protein
LFFQSILYAIWLFGGGERQAQRTRNSVMLLGGAKAGEDDGQRKNG